MPAELKLTHWICLFRWTNSREQKFNPLSYMKIRLRLKSCSLCLSLGFDLPTQRQSEICPEVAALEHCNTGRWTTARFSGLINSVALVLQNCSFHKLCRPGFGNIILLFLFELFVTIGNEHVVLLLHFSINHQYFWSGLRNVSLWKSGLCNYKQPQALLGPAATVEGNYTDSIKQVKELDPEVTCGKFTPSHSHIHTKIWMFSH